MMSKIILEGRQGVPVTAKDIFSTCNFHLKSGQFDYRHVEGISGLVLMQSTYLQSLTIAIIFELFNYINIDEYSPKMPWIPVGNPVGNG